MANETQQIEAACMSLLEKLECPMCEVWEVGGKLPRQKIQYCRTHQKIFDRISLVGTIKALKAGKKAGKK